ncbi:hypothetical protein AALC17_19765 [Oscillospiraceae bacterium 38-13]
MKSNKTEKKFPAPEFPDKPTMEVAWQGVPLTWGVNPDSPKESPMLFDLSIAASATGSKMERSTPSAWASTATQTALA